jgi:initiation factor 1A
MPKNVTGGNKHKKGKNSTTKIKRAITYPDNKDTLYAYVLKPLGDCRFAVKCSDEVERVGSVRGSLYKNTYINAGDLVLIGLRDFGSPKPGQKEVCDILLKYTLDEISEMTANHLLVYKGTTKAFTHMVDLNKSTTSNRVVYEEPEDESEDEYVPVKQHQHVKVIDTKEEESESDSESINLDDL